MNTIPLFHNDNHKIELLEMAEIRFGPRLYSMRVDGRQNKLTSRTFLEKTVSSDDSRLIALVAFMQIDRNQQRTQLVVLNTEKMEYCSVHEFSGLLTPLSIDRDGVTCLKEKNGITKEYRYTFTGNERWSTVIKETKPLTLDDVVKKYGYRYDRPSPGMIRLRARMQHDVRKIVTFVGLLAVISWIICLSGSQKISVVSGILAVVFTLGVVAMWGWQQLFRLQFDHQGITKKILKTSVIPIQSINAYHLTCEEVLRHRSSQIESYTWYLNVRTNGGKVNLLSFNHREKEKALADLRTLLKEIEQVTPAPVMES